MRYVSSVEEVGIEKGIAQGMQEGMQQGIQKECGGRFMELLW